jgi:hypothetical protein
MMLIPDFARFKATIRSSNLSPFEIRYDEKRQFFLHRGHGDVLINAVYSIRGGWEACPGTTMPPYSQAGEYETVSHNPDETRIINATKLSGRNARGLGAGCSTALLRTPTRRWRT